MKPPSIFKAAIVISVLFLSSQPQWAHGQGNLVFNGGFDTDANGWTVNGGAQWTEGSSGGLVELLGAPNVDPSADQTVPGLVQGTTYTLSGQYYEFKGTPASAFDATLNGTSVFTTTYLGPSAWQPFGLTFVADSTSVLLGMDSPSTDGGAGYGIDNISIAAVPEPEEIWLAAIGAGALTFWKRKKLRPSAS
jgi:hypothetical protein